MKKTLLRLICTLIILISTAGVASASLIYYYQPELPKEAK